jgi:TPR repeat protein
MPRPAGFDANALAGGTGAAIFPPAFGTNPNPIPMNRPPTIYVQLRRILMVAFLAGAMNFCAPVTTARAQAATPAKTGQAAVATPGSSTGSSLLPATEAPPLTKPSDEELSPAFLEKPSAKAKACLDAYKAGNFDEARKQADALAKEGDTNGMFILGLCHQFGRGGPASLPEAERWFRQAVDKGHRAARTNLGLLLYSTSSGDKDRLAEAVRLLRDSAATDPTRATMVLGELYARGIGVTSDFAEADKYFGLAIKAGVPRGWLAKGLLYGGAFGFEKQKDDAKADEVFKKAADEGVVEAMIMLGQRRLSASKGEGPLFEEGLKWLEKAGDKGSGEALVALGALYEEGRLVKKDPAKAFSYYQKGAGTGNPQAITKLGYCYENGIGVAKDAKKAFENYKAAADRGLAAAIYNVAVCYDTGMGVEKSPATSFRYFAASAKAGLAAGMNETGLRYVAGAGTNDDVVAAAAWFALAAQGGNVDSQLNLARLYLQGIGVPRNLGSAVQLYTAAVNAGHPTAAFELAQLYEYGVGATRDPIKAHALYSMAADFKTEKAADRRDALAKNMSKEQLTAAEMARKGLPAPAAPSAAGSPTATSTKPGEEATETKPPARKR